jgi:hypothetical protein
METSACYRQAQKIKDNRIARKAEEEEEFSSDFCLSQ